MSNTIPVESWKEQTVSVGTFCGSPRLTVYFPHNRPSWKRYGDGTAIIEFAANPAGGWLSINATETAENNHGKTTMLTLNQDSVNALHKFLDQHTVGLDEVGTHFEVEEQRETGEWVSSRVQFSHAELAEAYAAGACVGVRHRVVKVTREVAGP